ncbi:MAG TPA: gamma-glutamyl-gamma-aminobutyrate hydrolase family protein [Gaiellales bacterium]|nr:gamma-glutamyl-gamma-aminobutyrate hydrolase family protein [Gaiellales bacterium]
MPRHPIVQIDTEHPSAFGVGPTRWRGRLRRRLEVASGRQVEVVHYLDVRDLSDAHTIVLSGSSAPWAAHDPAALDRLGEAVSASGRPVLGICAGMQLLGRFAGARIDHAAEPEIGELEVEVVERDGLLRNAGDHPRVFQYHTDELLELPPGFRLLATTDRCRVQALASEERGWWGTQFHPESYRSANPAGARILRTFFELADGR